MLNVVYKQYFRDAQRRGLVFEIMKDEFMHLVAQRCGYCGSEPSTIASRLTANGTFTYNGLDRVNNRGGYTLSNVVPCCRPCNDMKGMLDAGEFVERCRRIAARGQALLDVGGMLVPVDIQASRADHALITTDPRERVTKLSDVLRHQSSVSSAV